MKRALLAAGAIAAVLAVVLVAKCGGGSGSKSTSPKVTTAGDTGGATAVRPRDEKPDPRKVARVAIHGRVTVKAGGPLAGAQVCTAGHVEHVPEEETRDPRCVVTDAQGRYGFDDLYAGTYWVSASAPKHVPAQWRGPAPDKRRELRLEAGQRRDDIDLALKPGGVEVKGTVSDINGGPIAEAWVSVTSGEWWESGGSATTRSAADGTFTAWAAAGPVRASATADGYSTGSANGKAPAEHLDVLLTPESVLAGTVVEAEGGVPVAGATVSVRGRWSVEDGGGGGGDSGSATTDDQGRFRITRLAPGRYKPTAQSVGRYGEPADSVLLGLGQTVEGVVIPVHAVQVVTGRIVIDDGASKLTPCAHGYVWLDSKTDRDFSASTEPDGTIRIEAIVPGAYKVNAHCEGQVEEDEYPDLVIAKADVIGLEWKVHPGGSITGTVKTKAGAPVDAVFVNARTVGGDPRGQRSWGGERSEDDGTFTLRGLSPGEYVVEIEAAKYPRPKDPVKATVAAGQPTRVDIVVDTGGTIAGVVVDDRGKPVAGARVTANGETYEWGGGGERSGEDGTFSIEGLAAGSYRVIASRGWSDQMRRPGSNDDDVQGERTTVATGQTVQVRLVVESQAGTIAGVVVDATGAPVPDAYLAAERESDAAGAIEGSAARMSRWGWDRKPVVTDAGGAFKLVDLSPGRYTVRAYRRGGGEAIAEHVAIGTKRARLVMKATGSIAGTVSLIGGGSPDEVSIAVSDVKVGFNRSERFFRTGGRFLLAELPAGTFVVRATAPEGQVETTVVLGEGEAKTGIALALEPRVKVTGRLVALDDGAPVPGLQVMVMPQKGDGMMVIGRDRDKQTITGPDGKFTVEDAPAGRVNIQAFPLDWDQSPYGFVRAPRTIAGGDTADVGDIKVPKRRTGMRDRGSDLGFDLKEEPPDVEPDDAKLEVSRIRADGPAAKSGLVVGDVITTVDGTDVKGGNTYLAWSLFQVPVGTKVTLGLARGASVTITSVPEP